MCRSKRFLAALLSALCLTACAAAEGSPNILYRESITETNVKTAEVARGEFLQMFSTSAVPYYPNMCNVRVEVSGARFLEYNVKTGDMVSEGDVLVTFTREVNEVALEKKRLALRRGEEDYARELAAWDEKLGAMYDELSLTTDPIERKRLKLEIQRAELQRDKYIHETEYQLTLMREDIADMEDDYSVTQVTAPMSGTVRILAYKQFGERLSSGEVLMTITSEDGMLFAVENKSGYFRYGMEVTLEVGASGQRVTVPGKVVATDLVIPEARRQHHAVIRIDVSALAGVKLTRPSVMTQAYYLDNVLVLPKKAVTLSDGKYSVILWEDGKLKKRYVNFAMSSQSMSLILDGVDEGDAVVIE